MLSLLHIVLHVVAEAQWKRRLWVAGITDGNSFAIFLALFFSVPSESSGAVWGGYMKPKSFSFYRLFV